MKLKPLGDRVILKPLTDEKKSKGGIILPETVDKAIARCLTQPAKKLQLEVKEIIYHSRYLKTKAFFSFFASFGIP